MIQALQRIFVTFLTGIGLGVLGGLLIGWFALPTGNTAAHIADLHPDYKVEYVVMVGTAYAKSGDWDEAQARLGRLEEPDPAGYVVLITEQAINAGRSPEDIRLLVRLAVRLGYTTPAMQPYLPSSEGQ